MSQFDQNGSPLNICMFSNVFPPIASGSSIFTWNLSRRLVTYGHQVSVITAQVDDILYYEENEGVIIYRLPAIRLPRLPIAHNFKWMTYTFTSRNLRWLSQLFDERHFDVIHQQNHVFDTILSSPRLARQYRLPLVMTIHTFAQHPNRLFNKVLIALDALARKVIFEKADRVVSPDPVVKRYVEIRHRILDSPVIPYGIEISAPQLRELQELKQKFGLNNGPVILSLGHVNQMRDRMDLLQAMPIVLQKFPMSRLLIVGETYIKKPVEFVKHLGLENHVTFTGAVPHNQVSAFFALSTIETHTINSDYPGPGIASMEAMAAGLPVITGEIDAQYNFSHFHNWENIVMVPPNQPEVLADAIIRLLSDDLLRYRISENARRMMSEYYSWDAVCKAYTAIYHQVVKHSRKKEM